MCDPGAQCCDGVCLADGESCAKKCGEGLVKCGDQCIVGSKQDQCCVGSTGAGIVCDPAAACCGGVCMVNGTGCDDSACAPGLVSCGGQCLAGDEADTCCIGPSGNGIICDHGSQCCDGICLQAGQGCAKPCGDGLVKCGGQCLPGSPSDQCCLGPTGHGIMCQASAECCEGVCMADGEACAKTCAPGLIHCGGDCLAGQPGDQCCIGPTGKGITCEASAQCCGGTCLAANEGCAADCGPNLYKCGGECLPGTNESTCCTGPTGKGILCGPNAACCDGICEVQGSACVSR